MASPLTAVNALPIPRARALTPEEYSIFKYHFLLGADWKLCCMRLKIDRGDFFHSVYRIEQTLGRTFRELQPYGLYPLAEYFGGGSNRSEPSGPRPISNVMIFPKRGMEVPLRKAA